MKTKVMNIVKRHLRGIDESALSTAERNIWRELRLKKIGSKGVA